jgi:hypothetical protein
MQSVANLKHKMPSNLGENKLNSAHANMCGVTCGGKWVGHLFYSFINYRLNHFLRSPRVFQYAFLTETNYDYD